MHIPISLFEKMFKRTWNGPGNTEFLTHVTEVHPYFSPAHFFLLEHSKPGSADHDKQASTTALLFNNTLWLRFQLSNCRQPMAYHKETSGRQIIPEQFSPENTDNNDDEALVENEIEPMKPVLKFSEPRDMVTDETPLFEPMHLVDYFASQGIKLSEEVQTADKLGKQLKSFTEWLKTMKKVHIMDSGQFNPASVNSVEQTDTEIQSLAEKSNKDGEVLTESMAEVFARQGKKDKAIEVYRKLSLLDTAKIAYFAAKIEQLKGT